MTSGSTLRTEACHALMQLRSANRLVVLQQHSGGLIGFDLHATETASTVQGTPFGAEIIVPCVRGYLPYPSSHGSGSRCPLVI